MENRVEQQVRARARRVALALALCAQAAAGATRPVARIALGSCADQDRPQPVWASILRARPDLFLFLGDNVYGDTEDMEVLRAKYARLGAVAGFRRLRRTVPVLAVLVQNLNWLQDMGSVGSISYTIW
jgi:alkaline phosphatase D